MQPLAKFGDVFRGIVGIAEMRKEKPQRATRQNRGERVLPDLQVDIRGRRRRQDEWRIVNANAGRVSDEGYSFRRVKVADVVRCVTGSVRNLKFARTERQRFGAFEDTQIFLRYRQGVAEKFVQRVWPQSRRAREQFARIDHVRRTQLVNINGNARIVAHQRAAGAGMVQMNVREQNGIELRHR